MKIFDGIKWPKLSMNKGPNTDIKTQIAKNKEAHVLKKMDNLNQKERVEIGKALKEND